MDPCLGPCLSNLIRNFKQTQETPVNTQADDPSGLSTADRTTERKSIRLSHQFKDIDSNLFNLSTVFYHTKIALNEKRIIDQRKDKITLVTWTKYSKPIKLETS